MDKVRIGFVGSGQMAQLAHIPNLADHPECELAALAEQRPELGAQIAERYRIPKLYTSHEALASDPDIDAVVAVTLPSSHAPIAIDLLKAGKHLLIEKPLATNVEDGERMVSTAEAANTIFMVSFMKRYDPGVELAKRLIDGLRSSGELGEITFARAHRFGNDWQYYDAEQWVTTEEVIPDVGARAPSWVPEASIGAFLGFNALYCHNVDLLTHLLGEVKEVEYANVGAGADKQVMAVLRFEGFAAALEGVYTGALWDEAVKIYFRDGWVEIKTPPPLLRNVPAQVEVCKAGAEPELVSPRPTWGWSFRRADDHFVDCVLGHKEPRTSGAMALKNLYLMEMIFRKSLQI